MFRVEKVLSKDTETSSDYLPQIKALLLFKIPGVLHVLPINPRTHKIKLSKNKHSRK